MADGNISQPAETKLPSVLLHECSMAGCAGGSSMAACQI